MIIGKLKVLIAPVLLLGLAACNNNSDNAAMDVQNGNENNTTFNRSNVDDSYLNRVNYRQKNSDNNDRVNVLDREGVFDDDHDDNLFDHRGPLTENYANRKGGNQYDLDEVNNRNGSLSSLSTSKSSTDYPHTRAILTQEAKYKFAPVNENQNERGQQNQDHAINEETKRSQQQQFITQSQNNQPQAQKQITGDSSQYAKQVVDLTNEKRRRNGLPDLKMDRRLSHVAQTKSQDMQRNRYFSHTSPTYGSPFDMIRDFDVSFSTAGENIAQGQRTPQEVVNAWMNSEGHRRNILNRNFTHIGVGYEPNGNHWTQMFIEK